MFSGCKKILTLNAYLEPETPGSLGAAASLSGPKDAKKPPPT